MVALPAIIVERPTVGGALDRSAALTRERRWLVLGIFVLVAIPAILAVEILGALTGIVVVTWLLEAALSTVLVSLTVVLYASLRGEKEGVTPEQIAAAVA